MTTTTTQSDQTPAATMSDFEAAIQESLTRIQSVYDLVPDFQLIPPEGIREQRAARSISDEFLEATVTASEADEPLKNATGLDTSATRLVIQRNLRLEAIATAAEALVRNVRYNQFRERWSVAQDALHVYDVAKSFSRRPRGIALVPHVRAMRKTLGRSGTRKAKPQPDSPTVKQ
jgi:hypothetical protein